jgi:hypothetical protein
MIGRVCNERPIRVVIELELDGASIKGLLRDEHGDSHVVSGLLGLFAALESVRDAAATGSTAPGGSAAST